MATHDQCKRNVYPARIVKKVFENIVQKVNMVWIMAKPSIHVLVDVNQVTTVHWEVPAVNKSVVHLEGTAALTRCPTANVPVVVPKDIIAHSILPSKEKFHVPVRSKLKN